MRRSLVLVLLVGLAGCNRHGVADVTLDADAAQRNATASKTLSDLAAAEDASKGPAPVIRDARPAATEPQPEAPAAPANEAAPAVDDTDDADSNG
jgi:hypothetical protein